MPGFRQHQSDTRFKKSGHGITRFVTILLQAYNMYLNPKHAKEYHDQNDQHLVTKEILTMTQQYPPQSDRHLTISHQQQ